MNLKSISVSCFKAQTKAIIYKNKNFIGDTMKHFLIYIENENVFQTDLTHTNIWLRKVWKHEFTEF